MASIADDTSRPARKGADVVDALLRTDPRDGGCQQTGELIHAHAEVVAQVATPRSRCRA